MREEQKIEKLESLVRPSVGDSMGCNTVSDFIDNALLKNVSDELSDAIYSAVSSEIAATLDSEKYRREELYTEYYENFVEKNTDSDGFCDDDDARRLYTGESVEDVWGDWCNEKFSADFSEIENILKT